MNPDTFTEGQRVTLIAAPGYPTEAIYTVVGAAPQVVTATRTDHGGAPVEVFTLRRNGKFALAGERQWSMYLRAVKAWA